MINILHYLLVIFHLELALYAIFFNIELVMSMIEALAILTFVLGMFGTYTILDLISRNKVSGKDKGKDVATVSAVSKRQ